MKKKSILSILLVLIFMFTAVLAACDDAVSENSDTDLKSGDTLPNSGTIVPEDKTPVYLPAELYFGKYPQSDVTAEKGEELSTAYAENLPSADNANGWTTYGYYSEGSNDTDYMWYKDVDLNNDGEYDYRGVYFSSYRPLYTYVVGNAKNSEQGEYGYVVETVYWFKFEPIKWRVLSVEGNKAILLSDLVLDSQEFYHDNADREDGQVHPNNYAKSDIRAWLNGTFFNTAFNAKQKKIINTVVVDNSAGSTNPDGNAECFYGGENQFACENTSDKIWLISTQEATKEEYGFNSGYNSVDSTRIKKVSDYAKCQGVDSSDNAEYLDNGYWWTRSPFCQYGVFASYFSRDGKLNNSGDYVSGSKYGVVPAMQITWF